MIQGKTELECDPWNGHQILLEDNSEQEVGSMPYQDTDPNTTSVRYMLALLKTDWQHTKIKK